MFQLSDEEMKELIANCDRFKVMKHSPSRMYAFTEQGVAMLSAVLKSDIAIRESIRIMKAFVAMRRLLSAVISILACTAASISRPAGYTTSRASMKITKSLTSQLGSMCSLNILQYVK